MRTWRDFHRDPRISYYLSLRRDYGCSASQAYEKLQRMDSVIIGLQIDEYPLIERIFVAIHSQLARLSRWGGSLIRRPAAH